jgi:hypothetical protein
MKKPPARLGKKVKPAKRSTPNPVRQDPTRTSSLRRRVLATLRGRFASLRAELRRLVLEEDAFGLAPRPHKVEQLFVNESYFSTCPRDEHGHCLPQGEGGAAPVKAAKEGASVLGSVVDKLKAAGASIGHVEHVAKEYLTDKVGRAVSKLPVPAQAVVKGTFAVLRLGTKTAFAGWTATQAFAERVSVERGATPEEARRLRGVLSTIDIAAQGSWTGPLGGHPVSERGREGTPHRVHL